MTDVKRLSIGVTPQFERDLHQYMEARRLSRKSEAIRQALHEAVEHQAAGNPSDLRSWLGMGLKAPLCRSHRFHSEDDLWS